MADHHHAHHHPDHDTDTDTDELAEMLDLDGEVLRDHLAGVTAWLHEQAGGQVRRILDLGSGTGTGVLALAERFPGAEVTAVDRSAAMLHRVRDKARAHGVADRIRTLEADLDTGWPAVEPVDLVWASASLHHLAEPDRVLADVHATLHPGGLFAVVELDSFPSFLPDPGLEARCQSAMRERMSHDLPLYGADWGPRLLKAGFTVAAERPFVVDLSPPLPAGTGRYAQLVLSRLRTGLGDRLDAADRAALDAVLDGDALLTRTDLRVRTTRMVWLAVRP